MLRITHDIDLAEQVRREAATAAMEKIRADVDYIAMIAGVDIPEAEEAHEQV
jgi:hypothetical protein